MRRHRVPRRVIERPDTGDDRQNAQRLAILRDYRRYGLGNFEKMIRDISRDPTHAWIVRLENGDTIGSLDLQRSDRRLIGLNRCPRLGKIVFRFGQLSASLLVLLSLLLVLRGEVRNLTC